MERIVVFIIIACLCFSCGQSDVPDQATEPTINESWVWENPYSFATITIPAGWQEAGSEQMEEAMLSLQHSSKHSLVYIMNEESLDDLSLEDYLEAIKPLISAELGIDDFETVQNPEAGHYVQATGAKYLGNTLAGTHIRIWSTGGRDFWRSVAITNMEYKSLEYEARELTEKLMDSSEP